MRLPNGDNAIVDIEKVTHYCLSLDHPRGRHKARRFLAVLGVTQEQAGELREALLSVAAESDAAITGESDQFGQRYAIDFQYDGPKDSAWIRCGWIIRAGEDAPRLTTCFSKENAHEP